tara:strand:- start:765 stop:2042 length:1278 start_codon:yes stop_codon:yes gene_type:complete
MSLAESDESTVFTFNTNSQYPINFNFTNKYKGWFSCLNCKGHIKILLNRLFIYKSNKNYKKLNKELHYLYSNNTVFLTPNDCKFTVDTYNKLCSLRSFLYKYIYPTLNTYKSGLHKKYNGLELKDKLEVANLIDLQFNKFNDNDVNYVQIVSNDKIYNFRISEVISIYKFSIHNGEWIIPKPINAKNPYTNEDITLKQHYTIYKKLLEFYCKKQKCLPEHYVLLKNSYFDIELFNKKYYCYLLYKSAVKESSNLSDNEWLINIDNYLTEFPHYCAKCFYKTKNVRKIFSGILELFFLNENEVYSYGDGEIEYEKLAKENNLYFDSKHEVFHRKYRRVRRFTNRNGDLRYSNSTVNIQEINGTSSDEIINSNNHNHNNSDNNDDIDNSDNNDNIDNSDDTTLQITEEDSNHTLETTSLLPSSNDSL